MGDIEMGHIDGFLGSVLPDVGSKNLSAGGEDNMGGSVVISENSSSLHIQSSGDWFSNIEIDILWEGL